MTQTLGPLTFEPIIVPKPWGGRTLARFGKRLPDDGTFGESWEIADLPDQAVTSSVQTRTLVASGPHAGSSLRDLIARHGSDLLGSATPTETGGFPLLVKFLDAREHLSVQVHPTAAYVASNPGTWLKTESWYVVDAAPGAVLYKGFRPGVAMPDIRRAVGSPEFVELLQPIDAHPGDFHHLPAGIVHALGAGVLVAEPQTPSDTTFRMYDWTTEYGRAPRELHLTQALETLDVDPQGAVFLTPIESHGVRTLVTTAHYWQREHKLQDGGIALDGMQELRILTVVAGRVAVQYGDDAPMVVDVGNTVVIPASAVDQVSATIDEPAVVVETGLVGTPH